MEMEMTTQNNESKPTSGKPLTEGTSQELEELLANPNLFMRSDEFLKMRGFKDAKEWIGSQNDDPYLKSFGQMES